MILGQYANALDQTSHQNRFRAVVYNKVDSQGLGQEESKFVAEMIPLTITSSSGAQVPVDLQKWTNAVERNPDKDNLVPTQLSSVAELKKRVELVMRAVKIARERADLTSKRQHEMEKAFESHLSQSTRAVLAADQEIRQRLTRVFGKLENFLA